MKTKVWLSSILATTVAFVLFFILTLGVIYAASTTVTFSVNLSLSGNTAPVIRWVQTGLSANPSEKTTRTIYIAFNATDDNGFDDIVGTSATIVLMHNGEIHRTGSCVQVYNNTLGMGFNCSVNMQYYDVEGDWTINVSVTDQSTSRIENTTYTFAFGALEAVQGGQSGISFAGASLGNMMGSTNDPFQLDNTGNINFTYMNLTAYSLRGAVDPTKYIDAPNFAVNATGDAWGTALVNNSAVNVPGALLLRDMGGSDQNESLYFWL
jgi:hypothetical protein